MTTTGLAGFMLAFLCADAVPAQVAIAAQPAAPIEKSAPALQIGRASGPITLDGRLDEADWAHAETLTLSQANPNPGQPTRFPTEARLLMDDRNIYVGITSTEPEPGRIAIHTLQRDGDLSGDDQLTLVFDTFGDDRTGFFFRVNAAGTRKDGLISQGGNVSFDWDGIWDVKTRIEGGRWIAEFRFPAQTLRFKPGLDRWGLNIERQVAREQLLLRWAGISLNASITDLQRTGHLNGVDGLKQGHGLSVSPFGLIELDRGEAVPHTLKGSGGVDVTYNVTPQITSVLAINPDFGEAEVDDRRVNLSRFPLFFPEKRPFFSEGSNYFSDPTPFNPFYTRRIGQFNGNAIPIDGGLKVLGAAGSMQFGLLDVQTRESAWAPATNLGGGRLVWNLDSHWQGGLKFARGDPDGIHRNSFTSADLTYNTSRLFGDKSFSFDFWGSRAHGDLPAGARSGAGFAVSYPNDLWEWFANVDQVGDAMIPALGFVERPGTRTYHVWNSVKPRPAEKGPLGWARQFYLETEYTQVNGLDGATQTRQLFFAPLNVITQSSAHYDINGLQEYEFLAGPFEIAPGVVIPAAGYHFTRWRALANSSNTRPLRAGANVTVGGYYGGRLTNYYAYANWAGDAGHVQLSLAMENDFGALPGGDFVLRLLRFKFIYAFSPDLSFSSYTQYDNFSRAIGVNNRLHWTLKPGNDLFVVWNRGWLNPPGNGTLSLQPQADQLLLKLRWTFRV